MIKGIKNLFLLTCVLFLSISYVNSVKSKRRKYCHANEFSKCWESSRYFSARVNGTGIPITANELDWFCGQQEIAATRCAITWLRKCGNKFHREMYENFAIKPMLELLYELCDPAMGHRETFLKQAPCLHNKVKMLPAYRSICVKDLQAGLEWLQYTFRENITEQFQSTCCMYNRWERCISDFLIQECGHQLDESIRILIGTTTTFALGEFCILKKFHPEADLCAPYYQPKDLVPKGLLSNSYGSWFFSYTYPNIGFGIQPDKDS